MLYVIDEADNVATALNDLQAGEARLTGALSGILALNEAIPFGHKAALRPIKAGKPIIKYATTIGRALKNIDAGVWVHIHNCGSLCDLRTGGFGAKADGPADMRYVPKESRDAK